MQNKALPTRRRFLRKAAVGTFLAAAGTAVYTWGIEPHWVEVVHRDLPIMHLPSVLAGRTLVQLSDLHVGPEVDDDYLIRNLEYVSDLNADLHALTGDFMTCLRDEQVDHAARVLSHLRPARLATLAVLGNHDYAQTFNNVVVADALRND